MTLNIRNQLACDKCNAEMYGLTYRPIKTQRGVQVVVCRACGLAQSFYTSQYQSRPPGNMSCDADRSSIRYTKSLVSNDYIKAVNLATSDLSSSTPLSVLDIGSNRGAFHDLISAQFPKSKYCGIEPDERVVDYVPANGNVIVDRVENVTFQNGSFDLVYCVHSLEHVISAMSVLRNISSWLKETGRLVLGVPKIELYDDIVEEIFIDPHTFHFRHIDIVEYAEKVGLSVEYLSNEKHHDVIVVLSKDRIKKPYPSKKESTPFDLCLYAERLRSNRAGVDQIARKVSSLSHKHPVLIWGAGRIFDCLHKQSSWEPSDLYVYDKFIRKVMPTMGGKELLTEKGLAELKPETVVFVASRDYFEEIKREALEIGFKDIRRLGE